ncbi:MAG: hypothetical protein IMY68_04900 [Bacteroidetes bacterium]|nr:hypothetical protein [Bacteroidota bacterium]
MKRLNLLILAVLVSTPVLFAGGLKTNTNQSAAWVRTMSRNATLGIDAVYFNPAGLSQLNNGLHLSLSNQSIFQTRKVTSDYMYLNGTPVDYDAELTAPIFPSIYAAYKMDKWTFSAGFNIIGGGGSADFQTGLPTFEVPVSDLVPILYNSLLPLDQSIEAATLWDPGFRNVTGYDMSAGFNGSSTYYGIQVGATYALNDMISVAIGGRYVMASNAYEGSLTGVVVDAPYGGIQTAGDYLRRVATTLGTLPPSPEMDAAITGLNNTAAGLDVATADAQLDATQTGSGFTPIISVNFHLSDKINIAARYEHHTKIELTNDTEVDDVNMFPDGEKTRADMPGLFALGAELSPLKNLTATASFNYYLDKSAYYGYTDESGEQIDNETTIDENGYTWAFSLEYKILSILGVSAGYTSGNNGVNDNYQSGLTYGLKSASWGAGVFVELGEMITLNAGYSATSYDDYSKSQSSSISVPYTDTYAKSTNMFAIGIDFSF